MSRFFPHTSYAEDQPFPRTILTYHVLSRAWQTGAVLGLSFGTLRALPRRAPLATALLPTGYGALIGTAVMIPGLPAYMAGRETIEWKDRTWRLLENEGQMEVEDWSSVGFVGGAVTAAWNSRGVRQAGKVGLVRIAGGAAVGDLVGVVGYMVWRYGVHGGKWPEKV